MDAHQIKSTLTENYNALAAAYERAVVPVFRPIAKRMIQLIDLRPGWQVLDAGTGTGLVALLGAARVGKIGKMMGVDAAEKMLELARHKAEQFGFTQCEFRVGDLEALDLPDAQFNAVLSQFALHHTDPAKAMREFARVLLPGGTLVVHEWADTADTPNKVMIDILFKYRAADAGGALARAQAERAYNFRVKVATEAGMNELAKSAGFSDARTQVEEHHLRLASVDAFIDYAAAAPLVFAELAALSPEARVNLHDEARQSLRSFETAQGFEWTYSVLSLVAQK
jgi:ubiquinone/menaquinone biosynthesis C-methylase UbiE